MRNLLVFYSSWCIRCDRCEQSYLWTRQNFRLFPLQLPQSLFLPVPIFEYKERMRDGWVGEDECDGLLVNVPGKHRLSMNETQILTMCKDSPWRCLWILLSVVVNVNRTKEPSSNLPGQQCQNEETHKDDDAKECVLHGGGFRLQKKVHGRYLCMIFRTRDEVRVFNAGNKWGGLYGKTWNRCGFIYEHMSCIGRMHSGARMVT